MKIAVLVSGGVDSSVALRLLHEQGHQVEAFYLKIWLEDELAYLGDCPWEEDLAYAQAVCDAINIPLHVIPLQKEYWAEVVSYTIAEVRAGRTPSPDLLCNQRIKFGAFLKHIDDSFEKIATGHYAQTAEVDGITILLKAKDQVKDQTYFLSYLSQAQLNRLMFPIGSYLKSEVRELATKFDIPNKERPDSQGICFLGKIKFSDFVAHHLGKQSGDLIEFETGKKIGTHDGFWFYTIGQRKGIRLGGGPWFVVKKDTTKNIVYISREYHSDDKLRNQFNVESIHWIGGNAPAKKELLVKIRHGEHCYHCTFTSLDNDHAHVILDGQDQGLAPGQFAVFYDGEQCFGCAVISEERNGE
ncbi:tRNA 2-thiouridine(34) synthase MnmA [Candidatus Dependentiae bacterium]|nr:tRNA 2-thiouridine(34) synthase MnmA [Candidatus Dependentiae bacterium]